MTSIHRSALLACQAKLFDGVTTNLVAAVEKRARQLYG